MVLGPVRGLRVRFLAEPRLSAAVKGRLDGDGGVARAVEAQGLTITRMSRVTGDDPGQVV